MADANADAPGASPAQPGRQWEQVDLLSAIGSAAEVASAAAGPSSPAAAMPGLLVPELKPEPDAGLESQAASCLEPEVASVPDPLVDPDAVAMTRPLRSAPPQPEIPSGPAAAFAPATPTPAVTAVAAAALAPAAAASPDASPASQQPSRLLILDTETTGLSPVEASCIEVGAVLFAVPQRAVLMQVSFLMPCNANPAAAINRIDAATTRLPQPWQAGLACFMAMVEDCDLVVAHNAAFDRQWFGHGPLPSLPRPWICSMEDIRWPAERQLRATPSVRDLALAYDIPVWAAHRALTDCIYLAQVFARCDDLEVLLAAALEPRRLYRACLSYEERHRAREAGFRWNDPVPRAWSRRLSEREATALPFPVEAVAA
jgi:DNA polymerase-3 subunit epsilon